MDTTELTSLLEALVFVSDVPVQADKLAETLELDKGVVRSRLEALVEEYDRRDGGIRLVCVAGGYQFRTDARWADWIRRANRNRPFRFSRAALECLAIIAYRQPVTRGDVEYLRGVDSGGVIKTLLDKRLIRILGKKDVAGRPLIYGTTREFLEVFGLHSLNDLPTLKEFSELDLDLADATEAPAGDDESAGEDDAAG
ncbi:condensin subunit ScpB [Geothermobacter ehrlichii]|uniref:Condensin subunit ScpB n=1 Tax=Geothermobacter ehrlichii TaxID=213224 RepID=A0A5D3WP28_9BACT|nr:SMC-Scp complex subunit ScpB [Geothermobacter ehrlichii]TYP00094.1 condensin subunit ScpB [Geothermobacter ehrlichii]